VLPNPGIGGRRITAQTLFGLHGAKVLTIRFQSAVLPTAADRKDAVAIAA
jgi:hypothetical protein